MKKMIYWMLALFFCSAASMNAQVAIGTAGSDPVPHTGSILDLQVTGKGVLLPQAALTNVNNFAPLTVDANKSNVGMIVYNTNASVVGGSGVGLYSWDGSKWRSLTSSGSSMTTIPAILPVFDKDGKSKTGSNVVTVNSPAATGIAGDYSYTIISGGENASVDPQSSANGQFSINFDPNSTAADRKVVVMVTDPAGNTSTLVFTQEGDPSVCRGTRNPNLVVSSSTLCLGGAVYMTISNPEENVNYVWMLGSNEVGTGNYFIATQSGTYTVYAGSAGCTYKASQTITTSTTSAPATVSMVVVDNGGIICGSGSNVKLTALGNPANVVWYQNGTKRADKTTAVITLSGQSDAGDWFAVINNGSCNSKPSNVVSVIYSSTGSGQVSLNANDVLVNGVAINAVSSFCPGGSLNLSVNNPQPGVTYKWYNGVQEITTNPYAVPTTQTSMLLRLVATDNSGSQCPAEANSKEKQITGSTPVAPVISGDNGVCSGQTTRLTVTVPDATSYEWFKNGVSQGTSVNNYIDASPANYSVRYTNSTGCISALSVIKTVSALGAPQIDWNEFVTSVNESSTYTFSVRSTGTSAATAYIWSAEPSTNATITGTGNSVNIKFTGDASISVTPTNNCGPGSAISKTVKVNYSNLPAVVITPNSGSFCNSVSFKISRPASGWSDAEWMGLSNSNITATRAGLAYTGFLTFDGTAYYYSVVASGSSQTAGITVSGSIGSKPITTASSTVTVSTSTESSFSLTGTSCFDIAYKVEGSSCGSLSDRQPNKADFTKTYTYTLTGTKGSSATIQSIAWSYTNLNGAVVQFTPSAKSTTIENNTVSVQFNPALSSTALGETGVEVQITAVVTTTSSGCGQAVYTVNIPVKIRDCQCGCPVKISSTSYLTMKCYNLGADESADWRVPSKALNGNYYQWGKYDPVGTVEASGSVTGWTGSPSNNKNHPNWTDSEPDPCPAGWRIPTRAEWVAVGTNNTFTISGSWGNNTTNFSAGYKLIPKGTSDFAAWFPAAGYLHGSYGSLQQRGLYGFYSTSTQYSTTNCYTLAFTNSFVNYQSGNDKNSGYSIRCVQQ